MHKNWIKKGLILFFAAMAGFSILSRAADSLTVPRVTVDSIRTKNLRYELYGSGTIKENASKYVVIEPNQRIDKVWVKEGGTVKTGDRLYAYDMSVLQEAYDKADKEWEKQKLAYEKLQAEAGNGSALTDQKLKELTIIQAEDAVSKAEEDLKKAQKDLKKQKRENVIKCREEYDTIKRETEKAVKAAQKEITNAEDNKSVFTDKMNEIKEGLRVYKEAVLSKDETQIAAGVTKLEEIYFGDSYKEHKKQTADAEKALVRAKENWLYEGMDDTNRELKRAIQDAQDTYDDLMAEDLKLSKLIKDYQFALEQGVESDKKSAENICYNFIYEKQNMKQREIDKAERTLKDAKDTLTDTTKEWEEKLEKADKAKEKAEQEFTAIRSGDYDMTEELKSYFDAIEKAQMNLSEVKLQAEKEEHQRDEDETGVQIQLKSLSLDLEMAADTLSEIKELIDKKGVIVSPSDGIVIKQELEPGLTTSGQEKLILALKSCSFEAEADAEDLEPFGEGDTIWLTKDGEQRKKEFQITYIQSGDENGKKIVGVELPDGEYTIGSGYSFTIEKDSSSYDNCVPIQALRKDNSGTFVLVTEERSGILGKEQYLRKISVNVLAKDNTSAALETGLSKEDKIVVRSSKAVQEKDRVRIYEE